MQCIGILFRCDNSTSNCYYFSIAQDGSYELGLYRNTTYQKLKDGSSTSINKGPGQLNEIAVVAQGSQLDFYVNLQRVDGISNGYYTSGQVGMAVAGTTQSTEANFNNAQVWELWLLSGLKTRGFLGRSL